MAEFEEENEAISDEECLQIAQHYLLSSPPGQFQEVLTGSKPISHTVFLPFELTIL